MPVQQNCNKVHDDDDWAPTRANAVDFLGTRITRADLAIGRGMYAETLEVKLPLHIARLVLETAKAGVHKGQGRKRPSLTWLMKKRRQAMILWARKRKK